MPVRDERGAPAAPSPEPNVPEVVERAASAFFQTLSAVRGKRIFHPRGDGFDADLEVDRPLHRYDGIPFLSQRGSYPATVRLSRALGLPRALPDLLGMGIRIEPGPQDLLLVSSGRPLALRHLLLPSRGAFSDNTYSSILPYRINGDLKLLGALPCGPLEFDLAVAGLSGEWEPFGRLRLRAALDPELIEALELNPWNTLAGVEPVGPMNGLRRSSYAGSQRGRERRRTGGQPAG